MAQSDSTQRLKLHTSLGEFKLRETVTYSNGGSSYFYTCDEIAVIVDEDICSSDGNLFAYSQITNKQNAYVSQFSYVYRFLREDLSEIEKYFAAQADENEECLPVKSTADRANLAESSPLERYFEEKFTQVYGPDSIDCLWKEYGIVDLKGSVRYLDYVVKTDFGDVAVEENGVTFHHPQNIGKEGYRSQLIKQNSCAAAKIRLYRFSSEDCKFEERFEDDIRSYLGKSSANFKPRGVAKERPFVLYEHQEELLSKIAEDRKRGAASFLVVLPTASGKSKIVEEDISRFGQNCTHFKALILVPTKQTKQDWESRVKTSLSCYKESIDVCTYAFMGRRYQQFEQDYYDYVVIDEAHHAVAPGLKRTIQYFNPAFIIGLTATDERPDKKKLEEVFGSYRVGLSLKEAMEQEIIATANVYRIETNIDLSHVRFNGKDYINADLEKTVRVSSRNQLIAQVLTDYFCTSSSPKRQGVVFCVNIRHVQEMERVLLDSGISAQSFHGGTKDREGIMRRFKEGKMQFLCACQMISEGWDYPDLGILVMARPTLSKVLYQQQLGRGLRRTKTKTNVVVIDVVDEYGTAAMPCSMHSLFANGQYVPFGSILKSDYAPGEMVEIDGFSERILKISEVDIFSFAEKYGDYLSSEQLARKLFEGTDTVLSWIKKKRIHPTTSFVFGSKKLHLFSPPDAENIRIDLNIKEHTDETIKEDFFNFLEERDYSMSYKMPFLISLLDSIDAIGDAKIDKVLDRYIAFYQNRIDRKLPVDRAACPYAQDTLARRAFMKQSMLKNPFEKFERKRFLYLSKDLGVLSMNHALFSRLSKADLSTIRNQMEEDLRVYYRNLEDGASGK